MYDLPPPPPAIVVPARMDHACLAAAAAYYNVPPELIVAVRLHEGGTVGHVSTNTNGSKDIGPMQINTTHLRMFKSWGISGHDLLNSECTNIFAGTYILHREIVTAGNIWKGVGNYHSRTARYHYRYRRFILSKLTMLQGRYAPYLRWLRGLATNMRRQFVRSGRVSMVADARTETP